ncbi:MAG: histidine phosphatase family protein [Candidatus Sungbacteria bacterium]|uniref:Histidine phosphatase family protein n=1 Tax=Candidatus Sungiibacteriota bacterium TaxID=2750080 RepID=A0A933DS35_9BACT|nr:histidine phosphatase family protein [Candidatus Sungbacteria bacterium]MBI4276526.1 histidine phosphatase family protein [Candidatus Uhrbacteria bacterium]
MPTPSNIYIIRHSKLDVPYQSHLEMPYEVLADLASGKLDPGIAPGSRELFFEAAGSVLPLNQVGAIYYNNSGKQSRRSKESAELVQSIIKEKHARGVSLIGNPDIKEVDFDLTKILPKEEFEKHGMPAIRSALYKAEIDGRVVESIADMYARIERIFTLLKQHESKGETVLIISHDFFMRVMEVYATMTKKADEVKLQYLERTILNTYFRGFGASYDLKQFKRL